MKVKELNPMERFQLCAVLILDQYDDPCGTTLRAEFRRVEEGFEVAMLEGLLRSIPLLLPLMDEPRFKERFNRVGRALRLADWRIDAQIERLSNGRDEIERFLRSVPLLTEKEVLAKLSSEHRHLLPECMRVVCADATFYLADQFSSDGAVHAECIEVRRILKGEPSMTDWQIALWWLRPSGWLDGRCPRDIYKENPSRLYDAAEQEVAEYCT